jgi:poly(A) polymerase
MQPRFERRSGTTPYAMIEQPRFRAAYDFLRLRADTGEIDDELADWWEDFALGSAEDRDALIAAAREAQRTRPREHREAHESRVPGEGRDKQDGQDGRDTVPAAEGAGSSEGAPVRKRRRRRRKPAGAGAVPPAASDAG